MNRPGFTYMISNFERTVLYTGVTNNIYSRMFDYKNGLGGVFASKYKCKYLMWYESHFYIADAIAREKQLKRWHKEWKWNLIKKDNPDLLDLSTDWFNEKGELKNPELMFSHLRGF